jgi:hypothetical protein
MSLNPTPPRVQLVQAHRCDVSTRSRGVGGSASFERGSSDSVIAALSGRSHPREPESAPGLCGSARSSCLVPSRRFASPAFCSRLPGGCSSQRVMHQATPARPGRSCRTAEGLRATQNPPPRIELMAGSSKARDGGEMKSNARRSTPGASTSRPRFVSSPRPLERSPLRALVGESPRNAKGRRSWFQNSRICFRILPIACSCS